MDKLLSYVGFKQQSDQFATQPHAITPEEWYKLEIGTSVFLATLFLFVGGSIFLYFYVRGQYTQQKTPATASEVISGISGIIDLNGYSSKTATLSITVRPSGTTTFTPVVTNIIPTQDITPWKWTNATAGKSYDVKALLLENGKIVAESSIQSIVAPAKNIVLAATSPQQPVIAQQARIAGTLEVHGVIPAQSVVVISTRKKGESQFTSVTTTLPAVNGNAWSWDGAQAGVTYEVQSYMVANSLPFSNIQTQVITAPALNEVITLNSTMQPASPTTATISGTLQLNGTIPSGSTISLSQKATDSAQFAVFNASLQAADGAAWSWQQAVAGKAYTIQAALISAGATIAQSQVLSVTAPATNQTLTINVNSRASGPSLPPTIQCVDRKDSTNKWKVTVSYKYFSGAQQYWVKIGNNSGSYDNALSARYPATTPSVDTLTITTDYILDDNISFYISYAYSKNSSSSNEADFSQFSYTNVVKCQR